MRTLKEITDAVRRNRSVSYPEMRYALVAYDVLLAQMNIAQDAQMVAEFFKAAESCPKEYVGPENDPENPEAAKWHTDHINNMPWIFDGARELLDDDHEKTHKADIVRPEATLDGRALNVSMVAPVAANVEGDLGLDWSTPDHEKTHKVDVVRPEARKVGAVPEMVAPYGTTPGQLPMTICTTCTQLYDGDACPRCLDGLPFDVPCYADRDGDCSHTGCPQLRDGEPAKTGRHCPLDVDT